jgi:hypothetical protein
MKYQASFDIWQVPVDLLSYVQAGQHIYAGEKSNTGVFLGVKKSGTVVVAWKGNMKGRVYQAYLKSLRIYAKGV